MAHKDYVARGRAAKKAPPPPAPSLPWVRIVVTVTLLAGFAFFLYSIKGSAPPSSGSAHKPSVSAEDPLPEMPEEQWDYPELLDDELEVEVAEQEKPARPYLMQCGSFRQKSQAEEMRARIAMQGLESQVRASQGKNGLWHRVILGPYDGKRPAERDRHGLRRIGITTCRIWFWDL